MAGADDLGITTTLIEEEPAVLGNHTLNTFGDVEEPPIPVTSEINIKLYLLSINTVNDPPVK